ncbi:MAG: hybrid sensor histidine kinase/response regulator, partial [Acidobacteria bacterium]|nr:hybrid sensor histidine kinase/response regulator [Acidobacteriota bacterium]
LDRVNEIIHLLLNFARPAPPKREETDVAEMLEEALQFLRPALVNKSISLAIEVARDVGTFSMDPTQMRHVVTNLVANAGDAIESDGSVVVRASLYPEGGGLIISIEDDGPGIPEKTLEEIFEPFFTTKFSGTGLGLPVVRSLIVQHRGRIEVESEVGRGTTFFILLPDRPIAEPNDGVEIEDNEES